MKMTIYRIVLLGLLLSFLVWDFLARIYVPREAARRQFVPPTTETVTPLRSLAEVQSDLEHWLPGVHGTANLVTDEISTISDLRLIGTFVDPVHTFAVFGIRQAGAGDIKMEKVSIGEEVAGFRLTDVDDLAVVLQRGTEDHRLRILDIDLAAFSDRGSPPGQGVESRKGGATANSDKRNFSSESLPGGPGIQDGGVPAIPSPVDESRQPRALAPGEDAVLPWDLPVVDELGHPVAD